MRKRERQGARRRYRRNGEHIRFRQRLARYGLTEAEFRHMQAEQGDMCAACACDIRGKEFIDHDHVTGTVRGLLCSGCNIALGHVKENVGALRGMIAYLETWNAVA